MHTCTYTICELIWLSVAKREFYVGDERNRIMTSLKLRCSKTIRNYSFISVPIKADIFILKFNENMNNDHNFEYGWGCRYINKTRTVHQITTKLILYTREIQNYTKSPSVASNPTTIIPFFICTTLSIPIT